jgi:anti-anti-sigma factor
MDIQVESRDKRRIVRITGKITFENCPALQDSLDSIIADVDIKEIVVDFKNVPFIDSSGVGEVLRLFKRMKENGGQIVLMNPNKKLLDLFLMYRFDRFMRICDEMSLDTDEKPEL